MYLKLDDKLDDQEVANVEQLTMNLKKYTFFPMLEIRRINTNIDVEFLRLREKENDETSDDRTIIVNTAILRKYIGINLKISIRGEINHIIVIPYSNCNASEFTSVDKPEDFLNRVTSRLCPDFSRLTNKEEYIISGTYSDTERTNVNLNVEKCVISAE